MKSLEEVRDIILIAIGVSKPSGNFSAEDLELADQFTEDIEQLIKDECTKLLDRVNSELIGEDEYDNFAKESKRVKATVRDDLRANQRKILADIREGLK